MADKQKSEPESTLVNHLSNCIACCELQEGCPDYRKLEDSFGIGRDIEWQRLFIRDRTKMPLLSFFERFDSLEVKIKEMDKYLDTLGAENTDLKERIEKLEALTNPEAGG